jgi:general secretion pathway protein K
MAKEMVSRERSVKREKTKNHQKGFVLVTVLIVISLLFPIVVIFYSKTQLNLIQAGNFRDTLQAVRTARSGVEGAIGLLKNDDQSYDAKTDRWAMQFPVIGVGDGLLQIRIEDEESRLNVNTLVSGGNAVNADVEYRLKNLITRLGGKPEIVDALVDWIDENSEMKSDNGAEDSYYAPLGYKPKNGPVDSLDELLMVKGFDKDLLVTKGLTNFITVAPTDGKLNVNTAPPELLRGLHPELNEGVAEDMVTYRDRKEFKNIGEIKNAIGINDTLYAKLTPLIKVNSSIFRVQSTCTMGTVVKHTEALLKRDGSTITVISWREF